MYNEELKRRFVRDYTLDERNTKFCLNIFNKTGMYEEKSQCDVAQMNEEQVQFVIDKICGASVSSVRNILTILRAYAKWCEANQIQTAGHSFNVAVNTTDAARTDFVSSPMHLARSLDFVFCEADTLDIQRIYRAYLWLAFMGFQEQEAMRVTASDINFEDMVIRLIPSTWQTYHIYGEAVKDLRMAANMTELHSKIGRGFTTLQRHPGNEILRTTTDGKSMTDMVIKTIRPGVSRAGKLARVAAQGNASAEALCLSLSYSHIYRSGIFYRTYEEERLGITPNFLKYVDSEAKSMRSDGNLLNEQSKSRVGMFDARRKMTLEYMGWKNAFTV